MKWNMAYPGFVHDGLCDGLRVVPLPRTRSYGPVCILLLRPGQRHPGTACVPAEGLALTSDCHLCTLSSITDLLEVSSICRAEPGLRQYPQIEGILPKGPYLPCVSMAGGALLAGYPRNGMSMVVSKQIRSILDSVGNTDRSSFTYHFLGNTSSTRISLTINRPYKYLYGDVVHI